MNTKNMVLKLMELWGCRTHTDLAERLGISTTMVTKYKRDGTFGNCTIGHLALEYDINPKWLTGKSDRVFLHEYEAESPDYRVGERFHNAEIVASKKETRMMKCPRCDSKYTLDVEVMKTRKHALCPTCARKDGADLVGTTYGESTIIAVNDEKVTCRCTCGNEYTVLRKYMKNHTGMRCAACNALRKRIDMVGWRLKHATVISRDRSICHLKCDCGKEYTATVGSVLAGGSYSCGCLGYSKKRKIVGDDGSQLFKKWRESSASLRKGWRNDYAYFKKWCFENGYTEELGGRVMRWDTSIPPCPSNCYIIANHTDRDEPYVIGSDVRRYTSDHQRLINIDGEDKPLRDWCMMAKLDVKYMRVVLHNKGEKNLIRRIRYGIEHNNHKKES